MFDDLRAIIQRLDAEVRARPGYATHLYRAGLLLAVGRLDDALRDCEEAERRRPGLSRPQFMKSEILRRMGRDADADAVMAKARTLPKEGDGFEAELRQLLARIEGPAEPPARHRPATGRPPVRRGPPGRDPGPGPSRNGRGPKSTP